MAPSSSAAPPGSRSGCAAGPRAGSFTAHRPGLLPPLLDCATTRELLEGIVRDLVGPQEEALPLGELFARHGGNVRESLRELYDVWAALPEPEGVPVRRTALRA